MAQTTRIVYSGHSPDTDFWEGADLVAQSQAGNYSVIRVSATAVNRGTSYSYSAYTGTQTAAIDGIGQTQHTSTQPSGYANGQIRWDQSVDLAVYHDANGNSGGVTLRQTISGWGLSNVQTSYLGGFPRIPKPATPPGQPVASEILPTSVRLTWPASSNDNGSPIDGYLLRRWDNAEGTGPYSDWLQNNLSRVPSNLTPGKQYRFVVYTHNGSAGGYSAASLPTVVRTLSGMWTKSDGVWKRAIPYIKVAGVWKAASVFIKDEGAWKRGG